MRLGQRYVTAVSRHQSAFRLGKPHQYFEIALTNYDRTVPVLVLVLFVMQCGTWIPNPWLSLTFTSVAGCPPKPMPPRRAFSTARKQRPTPSRSPSNVTCPRSLETTPPLTTEYPSGTIAARARPMALSGAGEGTTPASSATAPPPTARRRCRSRVSAASPRSRWATRARVEGWFASQER